jgi:6-pyruvoyl-tetrahydropterin synthase
MQLFVEHLTIIDSAYLCPNNGIVGESWICDIALEGTLDNASMVMDFGHAKKAIKTAIDQWVDHKLLVPSEAPGLTLDHTGTNTALTYRFAQGEWLEHRSPTEALCILPASEITPAAIVTYLEQALKTVVSPGVTRIHVTLRTEPADHAYYHYAHGLKKHDGNCQRIAHGHRSRLKIFKGDTLELTLTQRIASELNYKYIGTREDIISSTATHTTFAYNAPQGRYELTYPTPRCHLIDTDSTVECIAQHIASLTGPGHTVRAYEGVMKGAVASA